jgi:hypothetical protein
MGYRGSEAGNEAQDVESLQPPRRGLGKQIHVRLREISVPVKVKEY